MNSEISAGRFFSFKVLKYLYVVMCIAMYLVYLSSKPEIMPIT